MHFLQQKSNKALKLFGLKEFMENNKVPLPNMLNKLKKNVKRELSELSHHMHSSVYQKVWLDLMHAYCHGVLVYIIKILLAPLNNQEKGELDIITVDMF